MPYTPKTAKDYERELLGVWVSFGGTPDIAEGSPERQLVRAVSMMFETFDARLGARINHSNLRGRNVDLDDAVAQIMSGRAIIRGGATAAAGPGMQLKRSDTSTLQVFPAGIQFRSNLDPTLVYESTEGGQFEIGQATYPSPSQSLLRVVCLTKGKRGNAAAGTVRTIVPNTGAPGGVYEAVNADAIGGGEDTENDASLASRGRLLLASIAKSQPNAMRFLASRYTGADGTAIKYAELYEPADMPGYSELILAGSASLAGLKRPATTVSGAAGDNGLLSVFFDGPAASEPWIRLDGGPWVLLSSLPGVTVLHERGEAEFTEGYGLVAGQTYETGGHSVYTGVIADIQREIEGNTEATNVLDYGWRSSGTRVRARPSIMQTLSFKVRAAFSGVDTLVGQAAIRKAMVEYLPNNVRMGRKLVVSAMAASMFKNRTLTDFEIIEPAMNVSPITRRHQFETHENLINFV